MKKTIVIILFSALAMAACTKNRVLFQPYPQKKTIHISRYCELTTPRDFNSTALYFGPGDTLPFELRIDSDFIDLRQEKIDLVIKRKLFFRFQIPEDISTEKLDRIRKLTHADYDQMGDAEMSELTKDVRLYLGKDGVNWAPINDMRALKKAFGITGVNLSGGYGISQEESAWLTLALAINH